MIVVTAPTGNIGRRVLDRLLEGGEVVRVIARDPSRLPEQTRSRVEVVRGSHGDPAVVGEAFAGADAVFWLVPPAPRAESLDAAYFDFTRPACEAIARHGVRRVVAVSALGRGTPFAGDAGLVTAALAMEDMLAGTGAALRALALPSFMDNMLAQLGPIRTQGVFFSLIDGDRKLPTCATRDIAAVAAGLLLDPSWGGRGRVAVLGPEDLSHDDMARTLSEVLGKPVHFRQVSPESYESRFVELGMSAAFARGMTAMMVAKNSGLDSAEPRTPANTTPTSFRQWCEEELRPAAGGPGESPPTATNRPALGGSRPPGARPS